MNKKHISVVILAAGKSVRIGKDKMLLPLKNKTVVECTVEPFLSLADEIIIVTGKNNDELVNLFKDIEKIKLIHNQSDDSEMIDSLKLGLSEACGQIIFITPGDYPVVRKDTIEIMSKLDYDSIIPSYKGRKGHPIIISSEMKKMVLEKEYKSLRDFLKEIDYFILDTSDLGILKDIDTLEDYDEILKRC